MKGKIIYRHQHKHVCFCCKAGRVNVGAYGVYSLLEPLVDIRGTAVFNFIFELKKLLLVFNFQTNEMSVCKLGFR